MGMLLWSEPKNKFTKWCLGRERHQSGETHIHAYLEWPQKLQIRGADLFDVDGHHPNIKPVPKGQLPCITPCWCDVVLLAGQELTTLCYVKKGGDWEEGGFLSNLYVFKVGGVETYVGPHIFNLVLEYFCPSFAKLSAAYRVALTHTAPASFPGIDNRLAFAWDYDCTTWFERHNAMVSGFARSCYACREWTPGACKMFLDPKIGFSDRPSDTRITARNFDLMWFPTKFHKEHGCQCRDCEWGTFQSRSYHAPFHSPHTTEFRVERALTSAPGVSAVLYERRPYDPDYAERFHIRDNGEPFRDVFYVSGQLRWGDDF